MAEEYVNKESLAKHIDSRFGEISTPFVVREIRDFPTADVAPKSEVEELKGELAIAERHEKDARALFKDAVIQLQNARQEVAREIFAEIEKESSYCVASNNGNEIYETKTYTISALKLAELKKKYTEEVK